MAKKEKSSEVKHQKHSRSSSEIPSFGRRERHVSRDLGMPHVGDLDSHSLGPEDFSADVPLGNTDPTMVRGKLYGGMPNSSNRAKGRLIAQRGKYPEGIRRPSDF